MISRNHAARLAIVMQMSPQESRSSAGPDHVTLQALITWLINGPAQGRTDIEQGSLVHFYSQGTRSGVGSYGSFADWMRHVYWVAGGGESKENTFSLWGRRGDRLYRSGGTKIH